MSFESKPTETLFASDVDNMGVSFFSLSGNCTNVAGYCFQAVWTNGSTPIGMMSIQASNDGINWSDIPNSSLPVSGNEGNNIFNISKNAYYNFARISYVRTSGDGNVFITFAAKS